MGGMAKKPKSDLEQARTGGQLLMDCLAALGARKGFGVPGESYLAVLDAMYDHQISNLSWHAKKWCGLYGGCVGQIDG